MIAQLRRVRWAVRGVLTLGVAASVAANILHADRNPISETIAAWPPLALLLTVELISRVPVHRRSLAGVRLAATAAIAGIAAYVSYWHMVGVTARYGETGVAPYLIPLSVDGLVVVASVSLVELAGRVRAVEAPAVVEVAEQAPEVDPTPDVDQAADDRTPQSDERRPATLDDVRRIAERLRKAGRQTISRDALGVLLREEGLSIANDRAAALVAAARAVLAAGGRTAAAP